MRRFKKTMALLLSAVVVLSLGAGISVSADTTTTPKAIFVTFYGDSQTARGFSWVTDSSAASLIKISTNSDPSSATATAGDTSITTKDGAAINGNTGDTEIAHQLVVDNLTAGTKYYYQVGDGTTWSSTGSFTTDSTNDSNFSFIDVADTGTGVTAGTDYNGTYASLLSQAFGTAPNAAFVMNNGGLTGQGGDLSQWEGYAAAKTSGQSQPLLGTTTFVPTPGDTDTFSTQDTSANEIKTNAFTANVTNADHEVLGSLQSMFIDHFTLKTPTAETSTTNGAYYSFNYGNAHIMVLNTNDFLISGQTTVGTLNTAQVGNALQGANTTTGKYGVQASANWLTTECAANPDKWKIVVLQRAVQSVGKTSTDPDIVALRKQLVPIMAEDSIDLVLEGHDLSFTRSEPTTAEYNAALAPGPQTNTFWTNNKNSYGATTNSQVTETYNGVSTSFEINAQGDTVYPYGEGINSTNTDPALELQATGTPPNPGTTGGTVYIEPGVSNGSSSMYSYNYYDPTDANSALLDNIPYYTLGLSETMFPALTSPSTLRTGETTGAKLIGPTYAVVSVKGDKLAVTTYMYNAAGAPTVIDSHGVAKPVDQTALINQINALPSIDTISVSDYAAVKAAYDAYNALDAVDQTAVTNSQTLLDDVNLLQQIDPSLFTSSNPQTGSTANSAPFIILGVFCIGLISIMVFRKKIFRHSHNA